MILEGRAWKFGDNIDTDLIIAGRFLNISDENAIIQHCMENLRPEFAAQVSKGDILVAGNNFGLGSSREHAPRVLKAAGISVVIAHSFARIFYRNAFNIGLPVIESPEAAARVQEGDRLRVDLGGGRIDNQTRQESYRSEPLAEFMLQLVTSGGLMNLLKEGGWK
jgi:3-isopropylmalate/(R)-2-methylmalate dehydratase small subunit